MKRIFLLLVLTALIMGCTKPDQDQEQEPGQEETKDLSPSISFENKSDIYLVKIGKTITIEARIENMENTMVTWKEDGKIISNTPVLTRSWDKTGQKFITIHAINSYGEDEAEIRVDVVPLILPVILMPVPEEGYTILVDSKLALKPTVENSEGCTYSWKINGSEVSKELEYEFSSAEEGQFKVEFSATNEDGQDQVEFLIRVMSPDNMPFSWKFEKEIYNLSKGRKIKLDAYAVKNAFNAEYIWEVNGQEVSRGSRPEYVFDKTEEGKYQVRVTMKNAHLTVSKDLTVNVCPPEGTYKRATTGKVDFDKIYEYTAAPGQFINEGWDVFKMEDACKYAEDRIREAAYVSLGGFGGYIVAGFDHSIENDGGYNFQIYGNSFKGSSEPGIVYVMQDENGDHLPNDTWYELRGSETGKSETDRNYYITYFRPKAPKMPVSWTDSDGKSGSIDYLDAYHRQDFYYPNWIAEDIMTLRGTRLSPRTVEVTPGYWSNEEFEWGYADNFSPIDRLTDNENASAAANANHFKISDAMDYQGNPVHLKYIDFIKVQTGVNAKAGWLGENSTEVFGIKDYNLQKKNK